MHNSKLLTACLAAALSGIAARASADPITLIGTGRVPGTESDGLVFADPLLEDGVTPRDQVGGFGSAITYSGAGQRFIATPDRGPADGATSYPDRYYAFDIAIAPAAAEPVSISLKEAHLLSDASGAQLTGSATAFDKGLRFDSEGVRLDGHGGFYVSDEYGPFLYHFDASGRQIGKVEIPASFLIATPAADPNAELPPNIVSGRQPNRGMEGLAISPDGSKLFGIMQNALIQDGALDAENARIGLNNRILEIDTATGQTRQFVYTLEGKKYGVNEILAINDHELITIERDGNKGEEAAFKRLYKIDLSGASDVSAIAALPTEGLPEGVTAASKSLFLDLLDPAFGLVGASFPEKIEGLAFGPKLADGRLTLVVSVDNDFVAENDSIVWAFAIDPSVLNYVPQHFSVPVARQAHIAGYAVVSIAGQALLPVSAIDRASLRLGEASPLALRGKPVCAESDLNRDGEQDLACLFKASAAREGAKLSGMTTTGSPIDGAL